MKGDFTRFTFDPSKHYNAVLMQQGRVQLDADWNEQIQIQAHHDETEAKDVVGLHGAPINVEDSGFKVEAAKSPNDWTLSNHLTLSKGRIYVDGILCENDDAKQISSEDTKDGIYLVYLDVWQRHITSLEDSAIREKALGGPDTATRSQIVWQAVLKRVGSLKDNINCDTRLKGWPPEPSTGRLSARAHHVDQPDNICLVPPGAGYTRLENQLYRVEIHEGSSKAGGGTFKWSRDNGSVVVVVKEFVNNEPKKIKTDGLGHDSVLSLHPLDRVEVLDDETELAGQHGTMTSITDIGVDNTLTLADNVSQYKNGTNPKVRRWDTDLPLTTVDAPGDADGYLSLEDGVEIKFDDGTFRTGDYWLIPARTVPGVSGNVEWPQDGGLPKALAPSGVVHHYCKLALVARDGNNWLSPTDCRPLFPPLTELISLLYVGGDGQEALPGKTLHYPLQVRVANGEHPVRGARVKFHVQEGGGKISVTDPPAPPSWVNDTDRPVTTDPDGIAHCHWQLGTDTSQPHQQVTATLLDAGGAPVAGQETNFNANLSLADQVAYNPACAGLRLPATPQPTVQQGIDRLAKLVSLYHYKQSSHHIMSGGKPITLQVVAVNACGPVNGVKVDFHEGTASGPVLTSDTTRNGGIATCTWKPHWLPGSEDSQQVTAKVDTGGTHFFTEPIEVIFTADVIRAADVLYDPRECSALNDIGVHTVQAAIDELCKVSQEEGIHITGVFKTAANENKMPLANDSEVSVDELARGIRVECDQAISDDAKVGIATCFITLDLPFPLPGDTDIRSWLDINQVVGFQPVMLDTNVFLNDNVIMLTPQNKDWLELLLFRLEERHVYTILAHLTLKGNFIWDKDQKLYLDGDAFGVPDEQNEFNLRVNDDRTISGDGKRGGNFEMWFWLTRQAEIRSIEPSTGYQKTTLTATITGSSITKYLRGEGRRIEFVGAPGVNADNKSITLDPSGDHVTVTISIIGDAEPGPRTFVLTGTDYGTLDSLKVTFTVVDKKSRPDLTHLDTTVPVTKVSGIGPQRSTLLKKLNITTAAELANADPTLVAKTLGVSTGTVLSLMANAKKTLGQ